MPCSFSSRIRSLIAGERKKSTTARSSSLFRERSTVTSRTHDPRASTAETSLNLLFTATRVASDGWSLRPSRVTIWLSLTSRVVNATSRAARSRSRRQFFAM